MKKLNLYIVTAGLLLISSCSEWLDLRPENEIVLEDYWKTEAQVNAVLAACYRGMASDPVVERMVVWGELRSDNVVEGLGINNDLLRILNVNLTPTNYYADWSAFYSVINNCNTFLHFSKKGVSSSFFVKRPISSFKIFPFSSTFLSTYLPSSRPMSRAT